MSKNIRIVIIPIVFALIAAAVLPVGALAREPQPTALVQIRWAKRTTLDRIEASGAVIYARLSDDRGVYLLAGATPDVLAALRGQRISVRVLDHDTADDDYFFAYPMPGRPTPAWDDYGRVVIDDGTRLLLEAAPAVAYRLAGQGVHLQTLTFDPKPLRAAAREGMVPAIVNPDPRVQAMIDQVSITAIYEYTGDLSGEWPATVGGIPYDINTRYTYSGIPIQMATQYIGERFADLGLDVEYHTWQTGRPPNVIGELPGESGSDEILMITGHLDSTASGSAMTLAPGADDNASGSVAVLVAANILTRYPWRCTLRFAAWTGEEQGLLGSQAYAMRSYNAGENIQGVLNLDMIAWNTPASARTIDLHANQTGVPASMALAQLFADVVDVYDIDLIPGIVPNGTGASDHASFWYYGYNAILGIEDFSDFNPHYHSTDDLLANLDMSYYTDFVKASVATFAHMGCLAEGAIAGHVTDAALGTPLAATVRMTGTLGMHYEMTTDATGYYTQTVLPDTYTMVASAPGYDPATADGVVVGQGTTVQDFVLNLIPSYGAIAGYVTDADSGAPLAATVAMSSTLGLTYTTTADAGGYYTQVVASDTYDVKATADGYEPAVAHGILVTTAVVMRDFSLQPAAAAHAAIAGHVTDAVAGSPLVASLALTGTLGATYTTTAGADGYYTQTVAPDTYDVRAAAGGYAPALVSGVVVTSGVVTQDLGLQPLAPVLGTLAGTVTDALSGAPLAAAVSMTGTTGLVYEVVTGADGHYLQLVVPGTYTVTGSAPTYTPTTASGVVVTTTVVTQDLALQPFHRLLVDPDILAAALDPGEQISFTLWITNPAPTAIDWSVYELPVALRGDVTWLDVAPAGGSLAAGDAAPLIVTFDAEGLSPTLYTATLVFTVDRQAWVEVRVPAILTVGTGHLYYYLPVVMRGG